MKKLNAKSKSPAPATSAAKPAKKKVAPPVTKVTAPVVAPKAIAPVAAKVADPAPAAVKAVPTAPVQTKIVARIDVGFGNQLFLRGDGPGLSWDQGVLMTCVASDHWESVLGESARPIAFKLLLNDITWSSGPDSSVASGSTITLTPEFA